MSLVSVTGNVYDHTHTALSGRAPRLWFRPNGPNLGDALLVSTWAQAALDAGTGAFTVWLDNSPGVFYTPVMDWLINPDDPDGRSFEEWRSLVLFPGPIGGPISQLLATDLTMYTVLVSIADPPVGYRGWWLHSGPGDPDNEAVSGTGELRRVTG
ncbi:hypothetical protein [Microbacterium allomyrinae]|uniref:Uncharacterized protein n=1 Tax=Microbacterium allomyrinae TaxID=2830666 RepID=A0A9X1LRV7_9MICO|nr:hypothetical protein [Microbacterium allomyrinae]MCC2030606.1 hypothetical protein [Microbacterium allomyrinae]